MMGPWDNDDEPMIDIPLSEPSDGSIEKDDQEDPDALPKTYDPPGTSYSAGIFSPVQSTVDSVDESSSAKEAILKTETPTATHADLTIQPVSTNDSSENPPTQRKTFIHPISEGGSVTWADHNDLVFKRGKERGPRAPNSPFPGGFKSQGPLPRFDFKKLREHNPKKEAVTSFVENYASKQEQVPTELVAEMKAYYDENENSHLSYLAGRSLTIQELNDTIKVQEQEIWTLKESLAEMEAIRKFSAKRGERINELSQDVRQREDTIKNLEQSIEQQSQKFEAHTEVKLEKDIKNLTVGERENEDAMNELLAKIHELEITVDNQKEKFSESERMTQNLGSKNLDDILMKRRKRRDAYNKPKEAGAPDIQHDDSLDRTPTKGTLIKQIIEIKDSLTESTVRCLVIQGKRYMDNYEASAALEIFNRAEGIVARDLPEYGILRGKTLYQKGKALYELRNWGEAVVALEAAGGWGFGPDCGELDGDSLGSFLQKARRARHRSTDLSWVLRHSKPV